MGFVRVLTLRIKSPYTYPLKGEDKSKIHLEAKFLEPWTFLCFFALFCPFLAQKVPDQIVCIFLHLSLCPREHHPPKKIFFFFKNDKFPIRGALTLFVCLFVYMDAREIQIEAAPP